MENQNQDMSGTIERTFDVSLFRPDDAEGVSRLFRAVHGDEYPIKLFYNPRQLIKANDEGDYYSTVARSTEGEIIGIHNLFRSAPSPDVYEWGVGLVLKEWRSQGVSGEIEKFMMKNVIPRLGMHTVFGEPVTNHVSMQKKGVEHGYHVTAIEMGLMPGEAYSGEGVTSARVSTLLFFRIFKNISQDVFIPEPYRDELQFMYGRFSNGRVFHESTSSLSGEIVSRSKMDIFDFAKVARIAFHDVGSDFSQKIEQLELEALKKGSIVIQVWFKLTSPSVGEVVRILQGRGYFLGGLLPQWFDDDGILMQKLLFSPDFESIKLHSEDSKKIAEFVRSDWLRTSSK